MKPPIGLCLLLSLFATGCVANAPRPSDSPETNPASVQVGELLVKFAEGISTTDVQRIAAANGATIIRQLPRDLYLLQLPGGIPMEKAVRQFSTRPDVIYAEPNFRHRPYSR